MAPVLPASLALLEQLRDSRIFPQTSQRPTERAMERPPGFAAASQRSRPGPQPAELIGVHFGGLDGGSFVPPFVTTTTSKQQFQHQQQYQHQQHQQSMQQLKQKTQKPQKTKTRMSIVPNLKLMSNSERGKYYRRRKKVYTEELEHSVAELREQVAALSVSRHVRGELALSATRTPLGSSARLVVEYCKQFALGAPVRLQVNEEDATAVLVSKATAPQAEFLRAVMENDVRFGEFAGIDLLLDQWERYSIYHSSIRWTLKSLEIAREAEAASMYDDDVEFESKPVVIAIHADLTVRFSRRTIEEVFPHLLHDEELVKELIGLEVTYPCINHFHFNERGKIEWYNPEVDFVSALMGALGSLTKVGKVLGHALIAENHMIGEVEDEDAIEVSEGDNSNNNNNNNDSCDICGREEEKAMDESRIVHVVEDYDEEDEAMASEWSVRRGGPDDDNQREDFTGGGSMTTLASESTESTNRMDMAFILG